MFAKRFLRIIGLCLFIYSLPAFAGSYFAFTGNFVQDDNQIQYLVTILNPGTVNLQSWSYAGGTDPLSNNVSAGGFAPVLSLFDFTGNLLGFDAGGIAPSGCAPRNIDTDGLCLDAYLQESLNAGQYIVVVTQQDNTPNGPTLADGFARDGQGNFTGPNFLGLPLSFIDQGLNQRNSSFEFTVGSVDSAVFLPEPSTLLLISSGMLLAGLRIRRARAKSQS